MTIAAIVATDLNQGIGKNNQLLWHLPADLKFFKETTMGCPVIMGRKTYESIGRLLPGRRNILITRSSDYRVEGAEIYHSLENAFASCHEPKVFVIGGADIFRQAMPYITQIYRTVVEARFDADTFIDDIDRNAFGLAWEACHEADEKNAYNYCFQRWERQPASASDANKSI